ncbi:MAG: GNAT family N-acetyltransferase [Clostridia bacterium]|nr:GNAT family N-acetyltransferase [Clostridia bacterium]
MAINLISDKKVWDQVVDNSPGGLLYHKWDFLKLIEKHSGFKLLSYGIYKGEELICVMPLFFKRIKGVKCLFSPPPQSGVPYLGFVMNATYHTLKQDKKESYINLVAEEVDREIKRISPNYFSASLIPGFVDVRPFKLLNFGINVEYTYMLDLHRPLDDIWKDFTGLCRQNIRKGQGLNCKLKKSKDVSMLTEFLRERYLEHGMNYLVNPGYLEELLKTFPCNMGLYYLHHDDRIIGASLNHEYNDWYLGWIGLTKARDKKYRYVIDAMLWSFIKQAKLQGYTKFEISGANRPNLCRFRTKFNPRLELCMQLYKKDFIGKLAEKIYLKYVKAA